MSLSDKIEENGEHLLAPYKVIPLNNVREFIKELKENISVLEGAEGEYEDILVEIDKLAGEKLI